MPDDSTNITGQYYVLLVPMWKSNDMWPTNMMTFATSECIMEHERERERDMKS